MPSVPVCQRARLGIGVLVGANRWLRKTSAVWEAAEIIGAAAVLQDVKLLRKEAIEANKRAEAAEEKVADFRDKVLLLKTSFLSHRCVPCLLSHLFRLPLSSFLSAHTPYPRPL